MSQTTLFDPPRHDEDPEELPDFSKMTREEIRNWKLDRMIRDLEAMGVDFSTFGGSRT